MSHLPLRTRAAIVILFVGICAGAVRAEDDYDYARALLDRDGATFQTADLIERLIARLDGNSATRSDSKLIRALLDRRQARSANAAQQTTLLNHAAAIYDELLAGPKNYAHFTTAEREAAGLQLDRVRALKKSAEEEPAQAKVFLAQAAEVMTKLAQQYKAQVDALYPPFQTAYQAYRRFIDARLPEDEARPIPREILEPLQKSFSAWLTADQRWLTTRIEELDCQPENDPIRKNLADEIYKVCESRLAEAAFTEQPVAAAWYQFAEGRAHALAGNYQKAEESWDPIDFSSTDRDMQPVLKLVLRESVRMNMKRAKYDLVLNAVNKSRPELFSDDAGKEVLVDYMLALTRFADATQDDYLSAIRALRVLIDKETMAGVKNAWGNEFARSLSNVVSVAREKHLLPALNGVEWLDAATGYMLKAEAERQRAEELDRSDKVQAKAHVQQANAEYESAIECLRSAIASVRKDEKNPAQRLAIEPKAWFSLGTCYFRMQEYGEAMVAYKALSAAFGGKSISWLPDQKRERAFYTQPVKDSLAELDSLLRKSTVCQRFVYQDDVRLHPRTHIPPPMDGVDIPAASDRAYIEAKESLDFARTTADAANKLLATDPKTATLNLEEAAGEYLKSAGKFQSVAAQSPSYEAALFGAAAALTHAHRIFASGKVSGRAEDARAKGKEVASRALEALQRYEEYVTRTKTASDSDSQQRQAIYGQMLLFRCELHTTLSDWTNVLKNCDAYVEWQRQNLAAGNLDFVQRSKFRALIELSAPRDATDREARLDDAWATLTLWRQSNQNDNAVYRYMLDLLSRRYESAAADSRAENAGDVRIKTLWAKIADIEELRFSAAAGTASLSDSAFHVFALNRAGRKEPALRAAQELLKKFDPKATGTQIPDEPQVWQSLLAKMIGNQMAGVKGIVRYSDLNKYDRCRQDHASLVDYMYDTPQGAAFPQNDSHRPDCDRLNVDLDKALAQIRTIRRNYPDCQTLKPELGENGRAYIAIIEDEIDFRKKIAEARRLVCTLALETIETLKAEGKESETKPLVELALEQIKFEREHEMDTTELKRRQAHLAMAVGNYEEALTILYEVRHDTPDTGAPIYFETMKDISCIYAKQKKWHDAAVYPEFIAAILGFDSNMVKERWPDMKAFLDECKSHKAK